MKIVEEQVKSKNQTHNMPMHLHRARQEPEVSIKTRQATARYQKNRRAAEMGRYEKKYKDAIERITMPTLPWEEEE